MRGPEEVQPSMWSYLSMEDRVPADHPLRSIRRITNEVLQSLDGDFAELYSIMGRPSIPPEYLLRALLLQVLYSVRSERQLMEQLNYNLLFRWFVGLSADDPVWVPTVFSKNRDRLMRGGIADKFFDAVLTQADDHNFLSEEHFTVDGTLLEAAASLKSFQPKSGEKDDSDDDPGNPSVDFHGKKRKNETHQSTTDPEALLYRKGNNREAKLCYMGHLLMENRNGLAVMATTSRATGTAERNEATGMIESLRILRNTGRITLGGDKGYDTKEFIEHLEYHGVIPHISANDKNRRTAVDSRTLRTAGYATSQKIRKRVEEIFGWLKSFGLLRKQRFRGGNRVDWIFRFSVAVYNILRINNLILQKA